MLFDCFVEIQKKICNFKKIEPFCFLYCKMSERNISFLELFKSDDFSDFAYCF